MPLLDPLEWRDSVHLTRDLVVPADRAELFARARRREFTSLYRGVYVRTAEWSALTATQQYEVRVKAAAASAPADTIFSHESAAVLWRLPMVGSWPSRAHVVEGRSGGGRANAMLQRHTVGVPSESELIQGVLVTTLARTVVDIARTRSFPLAVTMADAALRRAAKPLAGLPQPFIDRETLRRELDSVALRQGTAKARRVIDFADPRADRPGESMSRCSMHTAGLPMPVLQKELFGASGSRYFVDFWWPELNLIGEFDGAAKYTDPLFLRGRTPEQALLDEKDREDDLRAVGRRVSRWRWKTAVSPARLRAHLISAGVGVPLSTTRLTQH